MDNTDWRDKALAGINKENEKLWRDLEGENISVSELITGMKDACHKIAKKMHKGHPIHITESRDLYCIKQWCQQFIWENRKDPMDLASEIGATAEEYNKELWHEKAEQRKAEKT